jgi:hypothetical protein
MVGLASANCFSSAKSLRTTAQQPASLPEEIFVAISPISKEEFNRFFNEKYMLACGLLDCEAFKSWHTPSKDEWRDVLTIIKTMVKKCDWPLYEVRHDGEDASSVYITNSGLMLNAVHNLLDAVSGYGMASVPSPGQWGDIMRVVDETTERRASVDEAGKLQR